MKHMIVASAHAALATLVLLGGCEGFDDAQAFDDRGEPIAFAASPLIATVGTSSPVTVKTWGWSGALAQVTLADGNVTNPTGKYTITWKVTPAPLTQQRTLSITREEATGKLRLHARTVVLIAPDLEQIVATSTLDLPPHGAPTLTRWSQGKATITCPSGDLGPLVVRDASCYEPLFDQRVLSKLPMPVSFNGTPASQNWLIAWATASAYQLVYGDHLLLWDTLRYRADITAPTVDRNLVYTAIKAFLDDTGYGLHHGDINHGTPLGDENEDWTDLGHHAGFLDGHRAYIHLAEEWLTGPVGAPYAVPFRRTPAWIPTTVPAELDRDSLPDVPGKDVSTTTGGPGVRAGDRPGTICATYATTSKARLQASKDGGTSINGWHGGVHVHFGGHFRDFSVTANTPLFWIWHTTVDGVWANLQRCYLDDGASL